MKTIVTLIQETNVLGVNLDYVDHADGPRSWDIEIQWQRGAFSASRVHRKELMRDLSVLHPEYTVKINVLIDGVVRETFFCWRGISGGVDQRASTVLPLVEAAMLAIDQDPSGTIH